MFELIVKREGRGKLTTGYSGRLGASLGGTTFSLMKNSLLIVLSLRYVK